MKPTVQLGKHVQNLLSATTAFIILAILIIMGAQIFCRYFLHASLIWAEEACRYLFIWVSFLGGILAYERGEFGAFTLLRDSVPRRVGIVLAVISNIFAVGLLLALSWYGYRYALRVGSQPIPALNFLLPGLLGPSVPVPSMFWVYVALPVGFVMLAVRMFVDLFSYRRLFSLGAPASDLRISVTE